MVIGLEFITDRGNSYTYTSIFSTELNRLEYLIEILDEIGSEHIIAVKASKEETW